ncbi:MAG: nicotinate phosphoribosyltransferase [Planctomycetota bacterium]
MSGGRAWVGDDNAALLTDLYELTMLQAYFELGLREEAVFDLFVRRLPAGRNFLVACGLDDVLHYLETLSFGERGLDYLASLGTFSRGFLDELASFRFEGDVYAVPEGTPVFADEPILQIVAPLPQAQLVETFALNQVSFQTLIASKAARVVAAAAGRRVVEFGLRREHGTDAGMKAARACFVAGVGATSNVLAGQAYGIPVVGTMAHSFIKAHDSELEAFRAWTSVFPDSVLLVDTYDTPEGVRNVIRLARERGDDFAVRAVRLDSGDLAGLALGARRLLDAAGLEGVEIFASGSDHPSLDTAYKLSGYAGRARMKLSTGKANLPGRKQVYRVESGSPAQAAHDVIALHDEPIEGRGLLVKVMEAGRRLPAGQPDLASISEHARTEVARLPNALRTLAAADPAYPVRLSAGLKVELDRLRK